MRPSGRSAFVALGVMSVASGLMLAILRATCEPADAFTTSRHPAEPALLAIHRWNVPLILVALGWTIGDHVAPKLANGAPHRRSGLATLAAFGAAALLGTTLQIVDLADNRATWIWLHVSAGISTAVTLAIHRRAAAGNRH